MKKKAVALSAITLGCMATLMYPSVNTKAYSIVGEQPVAGITISVEKYYENTQNSESSENITTTAM